jgi:hypothetical protein
MGAPTSAILAEIFIQYIEHSHIINILQRHHIIITDYVVLIVYNEDCVTLTL